MRDADVCSGGELKGLKMGNQGLVPVVVLSTPEVDVVVAFSVKCFEDSGHPQFSGVHSDGAKENHVIAVAFMGKAIEEFLGNWFIMNWVEVIVFLFIGVEGGSAKVVVVIFDDDGPFSIMGGQFVEVSNEGKPAFFSGVVQGVGGKAMSRWKRKNTWEGSNEVVFEDYLRFSN